MSCCWHVHKSNKRPCLIAIPSYLLASERSHGSCCSSVHPSSITTTTTARHDLYHEPQLHSSTAFATEHVRSAFRWYFILLQNQTNTTHSTLSPWTPSLSLAWDNQDWRTWNFPQSVLDWFEHTTLHTRQATSSRHTLKYYKICVRNDLV